VLVIHEGVGLVDHIRDVCDRLARAGFVALAPDLYGGRTAARREDALRLLASLDADAVAADLEAAANALLSCDAVEGARLGAVGFCMGGSLALLAAARNRRIGAVADFYGGHPVIRPDVSGLRAAVLGIFAERDDFVGAEAVAALREQLRAAGVRASIRVQPGAAHGFMNDSRPDVHDAAAAAECWSELLAFLRAELA
jgi:carboxymethylenebutenolidase